MLIDAPNPPTREDDEEDTADLAWGALVLAWFGAIIAAVGGLIASLLMRMIERDEDDD
jgi:hypothetical protein